MSTISNLNSADFAPASPMGSIPPARRPRLAVFGGSFDPVHNGHLCLAGDILRKKIAEEVLFVPNAVPPHKDAAAMSPAAERLEMLKLAIEPFPGLSISDIEISRPGGGPAYTFHTMETLTRTFPEHEVCFLIGMDSLIDLPNWYRANELVSRYNLLICPRAGVQPPAPATLSSLWGMRNGARLHKSFVDVCSLPVSASQIRAWAAAGACLAGLLPEAVLAHIKNKRLYCRS